MTVELPTREPVNPDGAAVIGKVWRRIMWFCALMLLCSQLDKHNIAFAALTMSRDLGLTATMFGLAVSMFYVGYLVCEVPSNIILARIGARTWLSRISITLGLLSAATTLAVGANSLLSLRALLGMAEAGMVPGVLLYFTYWFPQSYRARANSWFLVAMPVSGVVAAVVSGFILEMDGLLGLAGWRWLFLLLGLPPIVLGVFGYFLLTDKPDQASWLTTAEKAVLARLLNADRAAGDKPASPVAKARLADQFRSLVKLDVLFLAITNCTVFIGLAVMTSWTPQIVRAVLPQTQFWLLGLVIAVPPLAAAVGLPVWAARSDARQERKWHVIVPMLFAAAGLLLAAYAPLPIVKIAGLVMCSMGTYGGYGVFWSLAASVLPEVGRPAGIGLIHAAGTVGAMICPIVVGYLKDLTGNFSASLVFAIVMLVIGAALVGLTASSRRHLLGSVEGAA